MPGNLHWIFENTINWQDSEMVISICDVVTSCLYSVTWWSFSHVVLRYITCCGLSWLTLVYITTIFSTSCHIILLHCVILLHYVVPCCMTWRCTTGRSSSTNKTHNRAQSNRGRSPYERMMSRHRSFLVYQVVWRSGEPLDPAVARRAASWHSQVSDDD